MPHCWLFDFDGVLCNSARETALVGLRCCQQLFGKTCASSSQEKLLQDFLVVRPCLETGWEAVVITYLLLEGHSAAQLLSDFQGQLKDKTMEQLGQTEASLKAEFQRARDNWIEQDEAGWLATHDFYPQAVTAFQHLVQARNVEMHIITTKAAGFTRMLCQRAGLSVADDCVWGLGSGPKATVIQSILQKADPPFQRVVFVEDRLETLESVKGKEHLESVELVLAVWGYNTTDAQARARAQNIRVLDQEELLAMAAEEVAGSAD
eukprot:m.176804 g.176804  ORF g.176804 m.176804 type:complete len:264 (+) comp21391_c0_seq2:3-794(+)